MNVIKVTVIPLLFLVEFSLDSPSPWPASLSL